ncbi:MAG: hypothetical protein JJU33_03905 [Phycisphaerales bacterium]|nr:hypothetical protein [Phycisphaerales bacterium]
MNRKLNGLCIGLTSAMLAFGLGACGKSDREGDGNREGEQAAAEAGERGSRAQERPAPTTEITMASLAGDWGFDAEEIRTALREQMEAELDEIEDAAEREQARAMMQMFEQGMMDAMVEGLTGMTITLNADGSMAASGVDLDGEPDTARGTWTLDDRKVTMTAASGDGPDEAVEGRVIDRNTIEVDFDEIGESGVWFKLRRKP